MKPAKQFSDDPTQHCKVFCNVCDKVVALSSFRKHLSHHHSLNLIKYKEMYGDPRKQIIRLVYHQCKLCNKVVLLDAEEMYKHTKQVHKLANYRLYMKKHMKKGSGLISKCLPTSSTPVLPAQKKATVVSNSSELPLIYKNNRFYRQITVKKEPVEENFVQIRCDLCPKVFKQNIQLRVHKRRNHSS